MESPNMNVFIYCHFLLFDSLTTLKLFDLLLAFVFFDAKKLDAQTPSHRICWNSGGLGAICSKNTEISFFVNWQSQTFKESNFENYL